ncbi:MAG: type II secretion system major pseudopilin GspG [Phycisphaerales bacterium]|nr:MAG: type II secretion system major pseudopilin GspG [Phycisphaerales bacterium]
MRRRKRVGFTLIEVLLVIAILGVLAAFVVPSFMGAGEQAKIDAAQIQVSRSGPIASSLDMYRLAVGDYPSTEDGLRALWERPDSLDEDVKWNGPYIADVKSLIDPWGKNEYQYRYPGEFNTNGYDLWAMGPDKEDGTDDDVVNWTKE